MIKKMTIILMILFSSRAFAQTVEEQIEELNSKLKVLIKDSPYGIRPMSLDETQIN